DAERLERVVNDQIIRPLMFFNFGPGVPLPKFEVDKSEPVDQTQQLQIMTQLADRGVPIRLPQIKRLFSIEEAEPGDVLLGRSFTPIELTGLPPVEEGT
ncbi:MAG: DUF935 family protein, partial [Terriglobia bacterium]